MNIIDLLKNGSGIHIKPENKGKFTKYCHGKVTSKCIAKGKRSSDPAVRKRATFAANARKWKHEEGGELDIKKYSDPLRRIIRFKKKGGFVNGVNVLDSNPKAYKLVKKKYKMRSALEGTKLNFWLKANNFLNSDLGSALISGASNLISGFSGTLNASNLMKQNQEAFDKKWKNKVESLTNSKMSGALDKWTLYVSLFSEANPDSHLGAIDLLVFNNKLRSQYSKEAENKLSDLKAEAQQALDELNLKISEAALKKFLGGVETLLKLGYNALSKDGTPNNSLNDSLSSTNFWSNPYLGKQSYKSGTFNSDGSMNLGLGGLTFNNKTGEFGNTKPFGPNIVL